jgi:hypothetical protein
LNVFFIEGFQGPNPVARPQLFPGLLILSLGDHYAQGTPPARYPRLDDKGMGTEEWGQQGRWLSGAPTNPRKECTRALRIAKFGLHDDIRIRWLSGGFEKSLS